MAKPVVCKLCGGNHYRTFCYKNRKPIKVTNPQPLKRGKRLRRQSDKEKEYQVWKETVARPALIERDGNACSCCHRGAYHEEKLDIEHTLNKGSHPALKRDLNNMTLMCRIPCHRNKTDGKVCLHRSDPVFI